MMIQNLLTNQISYNYNILINFHYTMIVLQKFSKLLQNSNNNIRLPWIFFMIAIEELMCMKNDVSHLLPFLYRLLQESKIAIQGHSSKMPFYYFEEQLNPQCLQYQLKACEQFVLNTSSLDKFVRILQLIRIFIENLEQKTKITKRNLFYKLQSYYYNYATLDKDIRLVCYNLWHIIDASYSHKFNAINKNDLGVIASNRCIIFGDISLNIDNRDIPTSSNQIVTIPTCQNIRASTTTQYIILIQKQSIFYNLTNILRALNLSGKYLLISAKGYPDLNTRFILTQLINQKEPAVSRIFYLGDFDVYGFDIFMFYAFGDWSCPGVLTKIQIIELTGDYGNKYAENLFNWTKLWQNMCKFNKEDQKKTVEINSKFDKILSKKDNFDSKIKIKIEKLYEYFKYFSKKQNKCELEMLFQFANNNLWLHQIIEKMCKQEK